MNFNYSKEEEFLIRNDKILSKVITTNGHINFSNYKKTEMIKTHSSNKKALKELNYRPKIKIEKGLKKFTEWYLNYYGK